MIWVFNRENLNEVFGHRCCLFSSGTFSKGKNVTGQKLFEKKLHIMHARAHGKNATSGQKISREKWVVKKELDPLYNFIYGCCMAVCNMYVWMPVFMRMWSLCYHENYTRNGVSKWDLQMVSFKFAVYSVWVGLLKWRNQRKQSSPNYPKYIHILWKYSTWEKFVMLTHQLVLFKIYYKYLFFCSSLIYPKEYFRFRVQH